MNKRSGIYLAAYFFCVMFLFNQVLALNYFDQVLAGVSSIKIVEKVVSNFLNFGKDKPIQVIPVNEVFIEPKVEPVKEQVSIDENIFLGEEKNYFSDTVEESKIENQDKEKSKEKELEAKKVQQETVLAKVLERLGLGKSQLSPQTQTQPQSQLQTQPQIQPQPQPQQNPFIQQAPIAQQAPVPVNSSLFGGQGNMSPAGLSPYTGNALQTYLGGGQVLATPYNGPGGSLPGDCGVPLGPIAYNKGGNSVRCDARSVLTGYMSSLRGAFGMGYINTMTENFETGGASVASNCVETGTARQYGEGCFRSYSLGSLGSAHVQKQILHWQAQGASKGQMCVPVDLDNCDSIGSAAFKEVLDQIENINNRASVKIKALIKNPHLSGCNFMSHPAVIGAVVEEVGAEGARQVSSLRSKPEQILLFVAGSGSNNQNGRLTKLQSAESARVPNSAYSYDSGPEYSAVVNCTYNP
jgi:hypothetical protein